MNLEQIINGLSDAESKLSSKEAINNPVHISENLYRLGQYASALEKYLGDCEEEYEINWAKEYSLAITKLSATAAKQQADVEMAKAKGNIKRLSRYVASSWKIHTGAMARVNHLKDEMKGTGI